MVSNIQLSTLEVIDHNEKKWGGDFSKMITSRVNENESKLIKISYIGVHQKSKLYQGVEHTIQIEFNGIGINVNRETLLYLISLITRVSSQPEIREHAIQVSKQKENLKKLEKKNMGKKKKKKGILLKLNANVGELTIKLNNNGSHFVALELGTSQTNFSMLKNGQNVIEGDIGDVKVIDITNGNLSQFSK